MDNPSFLRRFGVPAALTLACLFGAMQLNVGGLGIQNAEAYVAPSCPNSECHGPEMCRYGRASSCSLSGPHGPCTASWC